MTDNMQVCERCHHKTYYLHGGEICTTCYEEENGKIE